MNQITEGRTPISIRDGDMPLPSREDGYSTVLLVGTTGAGKTTLLRRIIGSNRFPPTSASRTTTADTEIINDDGPFRAVITFMDEEECKNEIEQCLLNACGEVIKESDDSRVARALLNATDQRFRLRYLLGAWDSEWSKTSENQSAFDIQTGDHDERDAYQERLRDYVTKIRRLALAASETMDATGSTFDQAKVASDRDVWMELFGEILEWVPEFQDLVSEIIGDIRTRFDSNNDGEFRFDNEWPVSWQVESDDGDTFLDRMIRRVGNNSRDFGRLLTPLVNGVRVRGPFMSADNMLGTGRKLVIIDGEGLGHAARTSTSVHSRIIDRFADVDLILLVDNAQQPLLAAPQELMKAVGSSGYAAKLAFAFTHFEHVVGDDMSTIEDRQERVRDPGRDAVETMRNIGDDVAEELLDRVEQHTFFFEHLDQPNNQLTTYSASELRRLLDAIEEAAHPDSTPLAKIRLSSLDLEWAIKDAMDEFHDLWQPRLFKGHATGPEHWTRIKALSLRMVRGEDGYDNLLPVADFRTRLQEAVSRWLNRQSDLSDDEINPSERQAVLDSIRQGVYARLRDIAKDRVGMQPSLEWFTAYEHRGSGSARRRADDINAIYIEAAPSIGFDKSAGAQTLINLVYGSIQGSRRGNGLSFGLTAGVSSGAWG